ncbi:MAG: hypothetical protein Kow00129_14810 [Thermoleophilia bacterium]
MPDSAGFARYLPLTGEQEGQAEKEWTLKVEVAIPGAANLRAHALKTHRLEESAGL